jgi:hypothetical protein
MAIIRLSHIVAAASGAVAGSVFVNAKGSKVLRVRPGMPGKGSSLALTRRAHFAIASQAWGQLTTIQRDGWRALARLLAFPNRLGELRPVSGFALYVKEATVALLLDDDLPDEPKLPHIAPIPFDISAIVQSPTDVIYQGEMPSGATTVTHLLYVSRHWSVRPQKFFNDFSFLAAKNTTTSGLFSLDFTNEWLASLFPPQNDEVIGFAVRTITDTNIISNFQTFSTTVITTP